MTESELTEKIMVLTHDINKGSLLEEIRAKQIADLCKAFYQGESSDETVIMPKLLTAENGAKGLMSGEFFVECDFYDDEGNLYCREKAVAWVTIKDIYAMAVKNLALPDRPEE